MRRLAIIATLILSANWSNAQCSCDSLVASIERGDAVAVQNCLDTGADPNCQLEVFRPDSTNTIDANKNVISIPVNYRWLSNPLCMALRSDQFEIVQVLIESGASPNSPEYCMEEMISGDYCGFQMVPHSLANVTSNKTEVRAYLESKGALSREVLEERGKRIQRMMVNYDNRSYPCKDSILKVHELISEWKDALLFDTERIVESSLRVNDLELFKYLVEVHNVSLDRRPSGYYSIGAGGFKRTVYDNGYSPLGAVFLGNKMTINTVRLLRKYGAISEEDFVRYFLEKSGNDDWDDKKVRRYYLLEEQLEETRNERRKQRIKKKMQRIYDQLEAKNGLEARMEAEFSEGCR